MRHIVATIVTLLASAGDVADTVVQMQWVDAKGVGANLGQVTISESQYGLVFTPELHGLTRNNFV